MKQTQLYIFLLLLTGCQWNLDKVVWNCDLENCVNGVCNESTGECECEDGYWGVNCDKEVVTFEKTFGGSESDEGFSVEETTDSGFIIAGYTYSYGNGGQDLYLIKTDMNGNELWSRTFGESNNDVGVSVAETDDGGFIITGSTSSYGNGSYDVYLLKTDMNGNELWSRTFGGIGSDYGNSVEETTDGGFIITGSTSSYGNGSYDVYLLKTDMDGNELWSRTFGGSEGDAGFSVEETTDGGFIITGNTGSYGNGSRDVYLIKTDSNGTELWSKTFGGSEGDYGYSVAEADDEGFIITGYTRSYGNEGADVYLLKTDMNGNELWSKTFGGIGYDIGAFVEETLDGGFIITGSSSYGNGGIDAYLIRTNMNGTELWSKTFGGSEDDYGYSVEETSDGGFIITGLTYSYGNGGENADVYLVKTDMNGTELWSKTFGGSEYDLGYSVEETLDGGFIVAGYTYSYGNGGENADVYLVKTDMNGTELWSKTFGGSEYDLGYSVEETLDGGFIVAGYTYSYGNGGPDVYLLKTDMNGTELWSRTFGGTGIDLGSSVEETSDGGFIITGYTFSYGNGSADVYLLKTDMNGTELWSKTFGGSEGNIGYFVEETSDGGFIVTGYTNIDENYKVYLIKTDANGNL